MNRTKKYLAVAGGFAVVGLALAMPFIAAAQVTTSTVGLRIDSLTNTFYDYADLAIAKFWPIVLGLGLLVAVIMVIVAVYHHFKGGSVR